MLIPCPHCGTRPVEEFTFLGDAAPSRAPPPTILPRWSSGTTTSTCATIRAGAFDEYAHHSGGCRAWLVVSRNTETHEVYRRRDGARLRARRRERRHDLLPSCQGRPHRPRHRHCASPSTASAFTGHQGDTLASALIANGVHLMGRSFKYHRPRGVITAGAAEPNALVELREGGRKEANTRATMIELYDGLTAQEPEPLALARLRRRRRHTRSPPRSSSRASTTRPSCGRRASGRRSTSP